MVGGRVWLCLCDFGTERDLSCGPLWVWIVAAPSKRLCFLAQVAAAHLAVYICWIHSWYMDSGWSWSMHISSFWHLPRQYVRWWQCCLLPSLLQGKWEDRSDFAMPRVIQCILLIWKRLGVLLPHWFGKARHLTSYSGGQKASGQPEACKLKSHVCCSGFWACWRTLWTPALQDSQSHPFCK